MTKFFVCILNHHASNHCRYIKSAYEDCAVTHISPAPNPPEGEEFSTNDLLLQREEEFFRPSVQIPTQRN